ncbi:sugar ABC transporter ATP-binding protein [bacterium 210820-DFI.6.37]|nr:sugar ABC transporter ATP-binding protein [bacterium 210820-DFI.6.37]
MSFKDAVAADRQAVFLDTDFFGDTHIVDGKEVDIVVDNDELKRRQGGQELAIEESATLFYCKTEEVKRRKPSQTLNVDGRIYTVDDWKDDMGISTVVLRENLVT